MQFLHHFSALSVESGLGSKEESPAGITIQTTTQWSKLCRIQVGTTHELELVLG